MTDFGTVVRQALDSGVEVDNPPAVACSRTKRAFDILAALASLWLMLPLMIVIAVAIKLQDGGPVLFRQRRTGLGGHPFVIYKFRSMFVAEDTLDINQATRGDLRVTPVGRLLRALSLDELPQLFNVLKGEMSLVGPRPHALGHDQQWGATIASYSDRFRTRPGLTGYAQVCGWRGEVQDLEQIRSRIAADNFYIENWSLKLEAVILARTVKLLFRDPQAY
ncbi:sugar transferase [Phenylobacterium sp. J367]|uniref:sugar transferase n=1 Tax=Phenylobacterium sp. J367 TaxID=2898435 RepID=UPI002150CC36|nr:sugar transferase [Phenylobacterium sp. J367]MCR5879523.1 sugar transferase [Phenylobacterium sp. J367]